MFLPASINFNFWRRTWRATCLTALSLVLGTSLAYAQTAPPASEVGDKLPPASDKPMTSTPKFVQQQALDTASTTRMRTDMRFNRCPPVQLGPPSTCIVVDAARSVDPLADPVTFRWQMGDGQTREGIQFEYCYAQAGRYVVQLDVVDTRTGEVREREDEYTVDLLKTRPDLVFDAPATARVGELVKFTLVVDRLPACISSESRFTWDFRDGLQVQGRTAQHTFRKAGTFLVRLTVDGTGYDASCLPRQCVTREVTVTP